MSSYFTKLFILKLRLITCLH